MQEGHLDESSPLLPTAKGGAPVPAKHMYLLYLCHLLSCWGDQTWYFAVPILLTLLFSGTILPASVFSFSTCLACILFSPTTGRWIDEKDRLSIVTLALLLQNGSVIICCGFVYLLLPYQAAEPPSDDLMFLLIFGGLILVGATGALAGSMGDIAVSRDWVVVLSHGDASFLADANAMLTRIHLLCQVAAPVAFSFILAATSFKTALIFVCCINILFFLPEIILIRYLHRAVPHLQKDSKGPEEASPTLSIVSQLVLGWKAYLQSRCFLLSVAFTLLFLTTLNPGPLLTAYLLTQGINEVTIAFFQGAAAVFGILPTFFNRILFGCFGVSLTAVGSGWFQFSCLIGSAMFFFLPSMVQLPIISIWGENYANWTVWPFLAFLVLSRVGLWMFDLSERQIMQENVPEDQRGLINSTESALSNIFLLMSYGLGMIASQPSQFGWLVGISCSSVGLAAVCASLWLCISPKPTNSEKIKV